LGIVSARCGDSPPCLAVKKVHLLPIGIWVNAGYHRAEGRRQILRLFFKYKRQLLGDFYRYASRSLTYYFEVVNGSALTPGVIAVIQTFTDRINLRPHHRLLVNKGGADEAWVFHKIPRIDNLRLPEFFAREV